MKKLCLLAFASALLLFAGAAQSHAQALPVATRGGILQVGGGYSNANTDEFTKRITGVTGYATFDFTPHLGVRSRRSLPQRHHAE